MASLAFTQALGIKNKPGRSPTTQYKSSNPPRHSMQDIIALEAAVEALPPSDLAAFRRWFAAFDSAAWDRQLESDASAGKLDALLAEAAEDHKNQPHRQL